MTTNAVGAPRLQSICERAILRHDFHSENPLSTENDKIQAIVNKHFIDEWVFIREYAEEVGNEDLCRKMDEVAQGLVKAGMHNGHLPMGSVDRKVWFDYLTANSTKLIQIFNRILCPSSDVPPALNYAAFAAAYAAVKPSTEEDQSLVKLARNGISRELLGLLMKGRIDRRLVQSTDFNSAEKIREWLADHPSICASINQLICSNHGLEVIPKEIALFRSLAAVDLSHNHIKKIPDCIGELCSLQRLSLEDNEITDLPPFLTKLTRLQHFSLANNQITHIPTSLTKLPQLKTLGLSLNPLLFICDAHPLYREPADLKSYIAEQNKYRQYQCLTPFSALYKSMLFNANPRVFFEKAKELSSEDRDLIFEMIDREFSAAGNTYLQCGADDLTFDTWNVYCRAVRNAVHVKFERLSEGRKENAYEKLYQMAHPQTKDPQWATKHAFDHILRLIDAMDQQRSSCWIVTGDVSLAGTGHIKKVTID